MSRDVDTYSIVQTRSDGVRERLHLIPAGTVIAGEIDFPKYCVIGINGGGVAFEKYPSGMVKYDEREIKFHLDYMFAADPVLTDYILAPTYENFVNVWTISDDGGNPAMELDDFFVRFRGIQIAQPSEEYDNQLSGTVFTVKILHVARYLAENAVPTEISEIILNQQDEDFQFGTMTRYNLYDLVYPTSTGRVYIMNSGKLFEESGMGVYNQVAIMFKFSSLFVAVQRWMQRRYREIMHSEFIELTWSDDSAPYHTCTFYAPKLSDGTPEISIIDNLSGIPVIEIGIGLHPQLWFAAVIGEEGHTFDYVDGVWIGGFVSERGISHPFKPVGGYLVEPDKFRSYKSIQDWLMDICSNFGCKLTYEITVVGEVKFAAQKVRQGTPIALSKTDFVREQKPYKRNQDRIRGCDAEVSGAGANDISQVEYFKDSNTENRPEGNIKCLFHNLPSADDLPPENWNSRIYDTPSYAPEIADAKYTYPLYGTSYPLSVAKRNGFRSNVLYCDLINTDFWKSSDPTQLVRVHRSVRFENGVSYHYYSPSIALPELNPRSPDSSAKLVQGYAIVVQKTDGLPLVLCRANTALYSNTMLYEGTAKPEVISPSDVGKVYDMSEFIHPALDGKTPENAVLRKAVENRDSDNNILPTTVELFAF